MPKPCIYCEGVGYHYFGDTELDTIACDKCNGTGELPKELIIEIQKRIDITREWLEKFIEERKILRNMLKEERELLHPRIYKALLDQNGSMIQNLQRELEFLKGPKIEK